MRFAAHDINALKLELEREFDALRTPGEPTPVYASTTTGMPDAADYTGCVLRNTTLNILAHSDGVDWIREDTGAAI